MVAKASLWILSAYFALASSFQNEVRFEQKLHEQIPNATLIDEEGSAIRISEVLTSKPSILVFTYYRCPNLCTLVLNGLSESLSKIPQIFGRDYQVITVSINPSEKPALARAKRDSYLARLGFTKRDFEKSSPWRFFTADAEELLRLTNAAGFFFKFDPVSKEYSHPSGVVILTPRGIISRYFFGIQFRPLELSKALAEAQLEKTGGLAEKILLNCLHYDPKTGKYSVSILLGLRTAAAIGALALLLLVFRLLKSEAMPS
jgi:protein SCO1/2